MKFVDQMCTKCVNKVHSASWGSLFQSRTYHVWFVGTCKASRFVFEFESAFLIQFDSKVMGRFENCRFENFQIGHACPLLVVVERLEPLTALSGTVYRLASSINQSIS